VQGVNARPAARSLATFARAGASSLAAVALEALLLTALVSGLHVHYLLASILATLTYFAVSFVLHRYWTFQRARRRARAQLVRYALVNVIGGALGLGLISLLVGKAQLPYLLGWAMTGVLVFVGWTHPMNCWFAFDRSSPRRREEPRSSRQKVPFTPR
jgi:putative flippase GtrA